MTTSSKWWWLLGLAASLLLLGLASFCWRMYQNDGSKFGLFAVFFSVWASGWTAFPAMVRLSTR